MGLICLTFFSVFLYSLLVITPLKSRSKQLPCLLQKIPLKVMDTSVLKVLALMSIVLTLECLSCRTQTVMVLVNNNDKNYFTLVASDTSQSSQEEMKPIQVILSDLNRSLVCYQANHVFIVGIMVLGFTFISLSLYLSRRASGILQFRGLRQYTVGYSRSFHSFLFVILGVIHRMNFHTLIFGQNSDLHILVILGALSLIYLNSAVTRCMVNKESQNSMMYSLQVLFLITLLFQILNSSQTLDETKYSSKNRYFLFLLLAPFVRQLNSNLRLDDEDYQKLFDSLETPTKIKSSKQFLILLESLFDMLSHLSEEEEITSHSAMQSENGILDSETSIQKTSLLVFWNRIVAFHRFHCTSTYCHCKLGSNISNTHPNKFKKLLIQIVDEIFKELIKSNNSQLLTLYINFLIDVKGDFSSPYKYLSKHVLPSGSMVIGQSVKVSKLDSYLFQLKIQNKVRKYSHNRNFVHFWDRGVSNKEPSGQNEYLKKVETFHELLQLSKSLCSKLIEIRLQFYQEIMVSSQYSTLYKHSVYFVKVSSNLEEELNRLMVVGGRRHKTALIVKLFFEARIEDDPKKVKKTLRNLRDSTYCKTTLSSDRALGREDSDSLVLFVGGEPMNEHKILNVSGKPTKILKFKKSELEREDLSVIMPDYIKDRHKKIIMNCDLTRERLNTDVYMQEFCKLKDGSLRQAKIFIKLVYLESVGLTYIGMILFDNSKDSYSYQQSILLDHKGGLIGQTESPLRGHRYPECTVEDGVHPMKDFIEKMGKTVSVLTLFFEGYSRSGNFAMLEIDQIMLNNLDSFLWRVFMDQKTPRQVQYVDSCGKLRTVWVTINFKHFGAGPDFSFYWVLNMLEDDSTLDLINKKEGNKIQETCKDSYIGRHHDEIETKLKKLFKFSQRYNKGNIIQPDTGNSSNKNDDKNNDMGRDKIINGFDTQAADFSQLVKESSILGETKGLKMNTEWIEEIKSTIQ